MSLLQYGEYSNSSGSKYVITCGEITNENKTTNGWLEDIQGLQIIDQFKALQMSHKKILEGILQKRARVVIKIADNSEDIEIEWKIYRVLEQFQIPGILKYFCFFRCSDQISRFLQPQKDICQGVGNSIQVLVMEYINNKSMKNFNWTKHNISVFHSCAKQCILIALEAYNKCGFVHGDFHLDNVLIQSTNKNQIKFDCFDAPIKLQGVAVKLMDFEMSKLKATPLEFFKNIKTFVGKLSGLYDYIRIYQIDTMLQFLNKAIESNNKDCKIVLDLLPMIESIESTLSSQSSGKSRNKTKDFIGVKPSKMNRSWV
jgi:serine/threonine protein kinase